MGGCFTLTCCLVIVSGCFLGFACLSCGLGFVVSGFGFGLV